MNLKKIYIKVHEYILNVL